MEFLFLFSSSASLATFTFCCLALLPSFIASSYPIFKHSIYPNFTASHLQFIDYNGAFLRSDNGTFMASILGLSQSPLSNYLSIIHKSTNTIIWTHNPNTPISESSTLLLTINGLSITDASNNLIWSTPPFNSPVRALQLLETGNLMLVDNSNVSLWESFNYPTDTIVMGQNLVVGRSLYAPTGPTNLSTGDYLLTLSDEDLILQWRDQTYWKLSMETNAFKYSNEPVSYMTMNSTGLNLLGGDGTLVFQVNLNFSSFRIARLEYDENLNFSSFRIARLEYDGRFKIMSIIKEKWVEEFVGPEEYCRVPSACGQLGLCNIDKESCSCPPGFYSRSDDKVGCVPADDSLSLPIGCNPTGNSNSTSISFVKLEDGMEYFSNDLVEPVQRGVNLSICQDLCSRNCSCLGFFYGNYSGVCYLLGNYLGSIMSKSTTKDRIGYIKTSSASSTNNTFKKKEDKFPVVAMVLIPLFGFFFLITIIGIAIFWLRKARPSKVEEAMILDHRNSLSSSSSSSSELNMIPIPGIPVRFDFEQLVSATENFETEIGSGGFGTVYRGTLPDETVVAVKKIKNLGTKGKKEFRTETAIIGSIHHVNLVRLKGFCIQGTLRFLVYEFMNGGSLEKTLFGTGPVLEWNERLKIAIGTAKGLAYLHSECQHKIIHCDIKPENILLHEKSSVKISDFGLSKLLDHHDKSKLLTTMRGTRGYIAPEWLTSSGITDKSDVYSFGMVLLEMVRGRRNCTLMTQSSGITKDENGSNGESVSTSSLEPGWAYFPAMALEMHKQRRYLELVDQRIEGRASSKEVEKLVKVALCCVQIVPEFRPTMAEVVAMLEDRLPLPEPRVDALNFLQSFGGKLSRHARD